MFRKFVLAAALAAGGFAAVPTAASAGDVSVRVGVGSPGYYGGGYYQPAYHRGYRHRYRERPYYGYYAPRPRYYGYGPARPRCRVTTVRSWNGYRYVTRTRGVCGRRYY